MTSQLRANEDRAQYTAAGKRVGTSVLAAAGHLVEEFTLIYIRAPSTKAKAQPLVRKLDNIAERIAGSGDGTPRRGQTSAEAASTGKCWRLTQ